MATNPELPPRDDPSEPSGNDKACANTKRRRIIKAGTILVPTLLTLRAKPAYATNSNPTGGSAG